MRETTTARELYLRMRRRQNQECTECYKSCELHGLTFCGLCHKHPGECDLGSCEIQASHTFEYSKHGRVYERRSFCTRHATSPAWEFLHKNVTLCIRWPESAVTKAVQAFSRAHSDVTS